MIGQTISHYKILELLGQGGMGVIYKAEDTRLKRIVALKFISTDKFDSNETKSRFIHEAQVSASLSHPHINTVYEIDEFQGRAFIAMEYIEGESLRDRLQSQSLGFEAVLDLMIQIAQGLELAHSKGIIHRDIKTSNIMLTKQDQAKIMDFGLSKSLSGTQITKTIAVLGTVAYMSPEQARGETLDVRSDIWSLGVVFFEMLTGKRPFKGSHDQVVIYSLLNDDPPRVSALREGVPLEADRIIAKCLEKDPDTRYQSVADIIVDLKRLTRDMSTGRTEIASGRRFKSRSTQGSPSIGIKIGLGIVALAAILAIIPVTRNTIKGILGLSEEKTARVAFIPFVTLADNPDDRSFCYGLVDYLTTQLESLQPLTTEFWVIPRAEIKNRDIHTAKDAARILKADRVITGRVERRDELVSISLRLVETKSLEQRSDDINEHIANVAIFQQGLISRLTGLLDLEESAQRSISTLPTGTADPEAFKFFLIGLGYLRDDETADSLEEAADNFTRAIAKDDSYAQAYARRGEALLLYSQLERSPELLSTAEQDCSLAERLDENLACNHIVLAGILNLQEKTEAAIQHFRNSIKLQPFAFRAYIGLGRIFESLKKTEEAEGIYRAAIKAMPDYWEPYYELGAFLYYYGLYSQAEEPLLQAIELLPDHATAYSTLGAVYFSQGRYDEAVSVMERSVTMDPSPMLYSNLGTVYFYGRRYSDALVNFQHALALDGSNYLFYGNLADTYRFMQNYQEQAPDAYREAVRLARAHLEEAPEDAVCRAYLANYYALLDEIPEALEEIARAEKDLPLVLDILERSVFVYELCGEREKALAALKKYSEQGGRSHIIQNDPDLASLRQDPGYQFALNQKN